METNKTRRTFLALAAGAVTIAAVNLGFAPKVSAADSVLKGKDLAYIAFGLQYEYQVTLVNRVKELAAEKGMSISVYDGKGDPSTQTTQLLDIVSKQPDIILLNPVDATLLQGGVRRANESGIPLFMLENLPPEGEWVAYNTFDDVAGGSAAADAMAKLIGDEGLVLEVRGAIGSGQSEKRYKGFHDRAEEKYPGFKIETLKAEWTADNAHTLVLDAFTRDPNVAGIWAHNDEMIRGVVSALRQIDRLKLVGEEGHVPIIGFDGTPLGLERIREGIQDADVGQNPFSMAESIVGEMENHFAGKEVAKETLIQPVMIWKDNVDSENNWGNRVK
ncbi:sugar ABC transporter substrate-binding protein [Nitratireductor kimnyeongensis]|uniref:Sugar ABC transporter substrate-binding protein n=1 Tax=Nitratireductor kimnyeongensis TaxID=430679 RepID=A0ABW0TC16_9HYPH|nr:sugar ABC transporter substrate-binding protein [Nitratireductor kimnyeongensis]QZZ36963.1 sugar ABC transporter substrate-binding protein [Nitratireductor kimnyeongensis]